MIGKEESQARKCFGDSPHSVTVSPIVVVPIEVAGIVVEVLAIVCRVGRCRPTVTVGTTIVELTIAVVAIA